MRAYFRFLILALSICGAAHATTYSNCVASGDSVTLILLLQATVTNDDTRYVNVETGTYALPGFYSLQSDFGHSNDIILHGGYKPGTGCDESQRLAQAAANTILDGQGKPGSGLQIAPNGNLQVQGFTFTGFTSGVYMGSPLSFDCSVLTAVADNIFSSIGGGVTVDDSDTLSLHENVFYNNSPGTGSSDLGPAGSLRVYSDSCRADVFNNTIAKTTGNGLSLVTDNGGSIFAYNNIAWSSTGGGVDLIGAKTSPSESTPEVSTSDFATQSGTLVLHADNIGADPAFVNLAGGNLHLQTPPGNPSPINSGALSGVEQYSPTDLDGNTRIIGSHIDMGAYESTWNDLHEFVVTSSADSGTGTLRSAISSANATPGPSHISFNISGGCGNSAIFLQSPLPDVVYPLTIDATTQPGWMPNGLLGAWNGNLCVSLVPNPGSTVARGLHTTSSTSQIVVKGINFLGFSDAAIRIEAGSGHIVSGNTFSAGFLIPGNFDAVHVTGSAEKALIGGFDAASSNLIRDSANTAVFLDNINGGSVVANNLIGIAADGASPGPNQYGIYIYNSLSNQIRSNFIGNTVHDAITVAGPSSMFNFIQQNNVGWDYGVDEPNGGSGVLVTFGANSNVVGAGLYDLFSISNVIRNSAGPGVWIASSAGNGNAVLGNNLVANGGASYSNGLSIDLGAIGPDANSLPAGTTGPNDMQNYPVLVSSFAIGNNQVVEGTLDAAPNSFYRLDFYYLPTPPQGYAGRGDAGLFTGAGTLTTDANGHCRFSIQLPQLLVGEWFSATATSNGDNTSETGNAVAVTSDVLFRDHFSGTSICY